MTERQVMAALRRHLGGWWSQLMGRAREDVIQCAAIAIAAGGDTVEILRRAHREVYRLRMDLGLREHLPPRTRLNLELLRALRTCTMREACRRFKCSPDTARRYAQRLGLDKSQEWRVEIRQRNARIRERHAEGATIVELASEFGISRSSIYFALREKQ